MLNVIKHVSVLAQLARLAQSFILVGGTMSPFRRLGVSPRVIRLLFFAIFYRPSVRARLAGRTKGVRVCSEDDV